ncbi:hypothetical protein AB9F35_15075 [Rhizobium leguminosarum]|uniref:hypothetical protein n=1 Tax=Rhizobium leguminosarum TaxID=384 RepID=UPI003F9BC0C9
MTEHTLVVTDLDFGEPARFDQLLDAGAVGFAAIGAFVDERLFHVNPVVRLGEEQAIKAFCLEAEG